MSNQPEAQDNQSLNATNIGESRLSSQNIEASRLNAPKIEVSRHKGYEPLTTVFCPTCQQDINGPILHHKTGTGTYLCCLIWCCVSIIPGLIPFCCDRCKDKVYTCPECQQVVKKDIYEPCNCK